MTTPTNPRVKRKRRSSGKGSTASRGNTPPQPDARRAATIAPHPDPLHNNGDVLMAPSCAPGMQQPRTIADPYQVMHGNGSHGSAASSPGQPRVLPGVQAEKLLQPLPYASYMTLPVGFAGQGGPQPGIQYGHNPYQAAPVPYVPSPAPSARHGTEPPTPPPLQLQGQLQASGRTTPPITASQPTPIQAPLPSPVSTPSAPVPVPTGIEPAVPSSVAGGGSNGSGAQAVGAPHPSPASPADRPTGANNQPAPPPSGAQPAVRNNAIVQVLTQLVGLSREQNNQLTAINRALLRLIAAQHDNTQQLSTFRLEALNAIQAISGPFENGLQTAVRAIVASNEGVSRSIGTGAQNNSLKQV